MSHETKPELQKSTSLIREVRGDAIWDGIKYMWQYHNHVLTFVAAGVATMGGAVSAFIQILRGVPVDWFIVGALTFFSFISIFIGITLGRRKGTEARTDSARLASSESPATQPVLPPAEHIVEKILPCPFEWSHSIIEN